MSNNTIKTVFDNKGALKNCPLPSSPRFPSFASFLHSTGVFVPYALARRYFFLCKQCEKTSFGLFKPAKFRTFLLNKVLYAFCLVSLVLLFYDFPFYSMTYVVFFNSQICSLNPVAGFLCSR